MPGARTACDTLFGVLNPDRIRAIRARLGVTQEQLAVLFGGSDGYQWVQRRERGWARVQGAEEICWLALERALERFSPIRVWGRDDESPMDRWARIFRLAVSTGMEAVA